MLRADAALAEAARLRLELEHRVATAFAICRMAEQARILSSGLNAASAISLLVRARDPVDHTRSARPFSEA